MDLLTNIGWNLVLSLLIFTFVLGLIFLIAIIRWAFGEILIHKNKEEK